MEIILDTIDNIDNYDKMIDDSINGTCFAYSWFMKLKGTDRVLKIMDGSSLVGVMPLFLSADGTTINQSTMYIPYGGPVFFTLPDNTRNKIRRIREIEELIGNYLKNHFDNFSFSLDPYIVDIMPFIRMGIIPELRYTYKIDLTLGIDRIHECFGQDRKKEIRICKREGIEFYLDEDIEYFDCNRCVEWEKKYGFPSSSLFVKEYVKLCIKNKRGMCFIAKKDSEIYGAVFTAWDKNCAYILYSYFDHSHEKDRGVIAFLYYNIFVYLSNIGIKEIDFEGSVYPSVEKFNISFGANQCRYYNLHYSLTNMQEVIMHMYDYYEK